MENSLWNTSFGTHPAWGTLALVLTQHGER